MGASVFGMILGCPKLSSAPTPAAFAAAAMAAAASCGAAAAAVAAPAVMDAVELRADRPL